MTSKNPSEQKATSELTRCDNCRQDILTEKMFLHEGFCHRNNVFCDHCEKVFLKTDYEEHLKDLRNSITDSGKSTDIDETEYIPVIQEIKQTITTVVNPVTQYEFIQMPWTEEYTINSPIVITESGNILSSQNNNEFILPYLGINSTGHNYGIEYGQNDYNYANSYDENYGNCVNAQMNFTNKNENYHFNNYQINLNTSNNEKKIETKKETKKIEKFPNDNQSSKYPCNTERINKIPKVFHEEKSISNKNEVRITNIKKNKYSGSPKRNNKNKYQKH